MTNNQNVLRFKKKVIVNTMLMNNQKFKNDTILNRDQSINQMIYDYSILYNLNVLMHVLKFIVDTNRSFII